MAENDSVSDQSMIVRLIMMLLSPGANTASMILLNVTLLLVWIFAIISLFFHYYNIHIYIIAILTTCLVLFVNYFATVINDSIQKDEEKEE